MVKDVRISLPPTRMRWPERLATRARLAGMLAVLIPLDSVEVETAVGEIAHGAFGAGPAEIC